MKHFQSLLFISVFLVCGMIGWGSCQNRAANFNPKTDTGVVAYWPTVKIDPRLYLAKLHIGLRNKPRKDDSTRNELSLDTAVEVKVGDTIPDGHGHPLMDTLTKKPIPNWYAVPDSLLPYIHIIPKPNR